MPRPKPTSTPAYHHGALRAALIDATEAILAERGLEGFTLREAARRVNVSPAAPLHHFGSVAGLLTEVAILGFEALTRYQREGARAGGDDPAARLRAQGLGYLRFALAYPARFQLMFRKDRLTDDPRLLAAGQAAFAELENAIRAYTAFPAGQPLDAATHALLLGAWSTVHGFAHLALDGKLDAPGGPRADAATLEGTLRRILEHGWP
ncbi:MULTISPECIES: TetR/AcrR family transcriptional regulator [Bordetella]|uniref:TetR family transcriptional regulator n=1 Tax=Bordetella genomosp. 2 TaxID=1983456 RepID=A0A261W1D5_9BORD|nr:MULTISPECIES: TetR/AcrR family transcriptional regulator [Bordetella]OZI80059.1 TetR family transcriptional regulator [Bordetella genomosp. 2]